jgi:predicted metal-dependent peptidase
MTADAGRTVHAAVLRVRTASPFFATLLLFARIVPRPGIGTAATDGESIFYEPAFITQLSRGQVEAVLLHEVLHCALLHVPRRGTREPDRWNVAADIVVNGLIAAMASVELPQGAVRDRQLEHLPVEEVYALLPAGTSCPPASADLLDLPRVAADAVADAGLQRTVDRVTTVWREAVERAWVVEQSVGAGTLPAGFAREFLEASVSRVDWRSRLWQFVVQSPVDFSGFDRRFIGQGIYLDASVGEQLVVDVAIDTSGSVDAEQIGMFVAELRGIMRAYPHIDCRLYYADSDVYGPYQLHRNEAIPAPRGGGGTSFVPFFDAITQRRRDVALALYFTDGYGTFPDTAPAVPVLWLVPPGGLDDAKFPFGSVLRVWPAA